MWDLNEYLECGSKNLNYDMNNDHGMKGLVFPKLIERPAMKTLDYKCISSWRYETGVCS